MNQNNEPIRDASVLGIPKMLLLGLQHMFAMFGATILVPILVNSYFGEDVLHVDVYKRQVLNCLIPKFSL